MNTIISTLSLRRVSTFKGPSSGVTTAAFQQQGQQNELPDIKFNADN
jgi:hypothetical protein